MRIFLRGTPRDATARRRRNGRWSANRKAGAGDRGERFDKSACHGQRWIELKSVPKSGTPATWLRNIRGHHAPHGPKPLGWYTGRPGPKQRRLLW